jgi:hypothetical protein
MQETPYSPDARLCICSQEVPWASVDGHPPSCPGAARVELDGAGKGSADATRDRRNRVCCVRRDCGHGSGCTGACRWRSGQAHFGLYAAGLSCVQWWQSYIPVSFFGLSVEYNELRTYERSGRAFDRVISLIRPRDGAPMLLRIGGKSADHVWWKSATEPPPKWVTKIGDFWLSALNALVRRDDLRLMLDLNLAVHSSTLAANFTAAAVRALPRSAVAAVEVGNEPDLYSREGRLERQRIRSTGRGVPAYWTHGYSAPAYRRDYVVYAPAGREGSRNRARRARDHIFEAELAGGGEWSWTARPRVHRDTPLLVIKLLAAELAVLPHHPAAPWTGVIGRPRRNGEGCRGARPREPHDAAADRSQLGQLRRQSRSGRLVRDRTVDARRPVRDDPRRGRRGQLACTAGHSQRAISPATRRDRGSAGTLRSRGVCAG